MKQHSGKFALVTGATSGIGYELAKLLANDGYNLITVARSEEVLQEKAIELSKSGNKIIPLPFDLFRPEAPFELYKKVKEQNLEVDVLVNNAGQGEYGLFVQTDIRRQLEIIQLNVASVTALTYLFLKEMVLRNKGKILQLASVASDYPGPYQAVYHATKAYILSFTEALANEIKDTNVTMTALQPGPTNTDFFNKAGMQDSKIVQDKSTLADPAKVAKDGYEALMKGDKKVISGIKNKIQSAMSNIMPDSLAAEQIRKQQEPADKKEKDE